MNKLKVRIDYGAKWDVRSKRKNVKEISLPRMSSAGVSVDVEWDGKTYKASRLTGQKEFVIDMVEYD